MIIEKFITSAMKVKATSTILTYKTELKLFEEWLGNDETDLNNYGRSDVQEYLDTLLKNKKAASTINKAWSAIKLFSRWNNNIESIEDIRVPKPKKLIEEAPKSLSRIERNKLLREIDRNENKRNIAIIVLLLNTGLRVNELVHLDIKDVQLTERKGAIHVIGKGYKMREVPLNSETRRALNLYLNERTDDNPALFLSNYNRRIAKRSVQRVIEKYGYHAHQLRHTFIRQLVIKGVDMATIKSLTGHESAEMIMRYSAPTKEEKAAALDTMYIE